MNNKKIIKKELNKFLKEINSYTSMTFIINIYESERRCMARVWEPEDNKNPDINRRCPFGCSNDSDLCKKHYKMESKKRDKRLQWCGRIDEYPPPGLLKNYTKRNNKIEELYSERLIINNLQLIGHSKFKDKKKLVLSRDTLSEKSLNLKITISIYKNKNKYQYNSNMESKEILNLNESSDFLDDYPLALDGVGPSNFQQALDNAVKRIDSNLGTNIVDLVNDKLKLEKMALNCLAEVDVENPAVFQKKFAYNELVKTIELNNTKKKEDNNNQYNIVILKKDIINLDSLRFIDNNNNPYDLYYTLVNNKTILINQNSKQVGILRDWIDDNDFVPKEYKTAENVVLSPLNKLPVFEIEISIKGSGFEPIAPGIYREYEYNEDMEVFIPTNQIIRN